MKIELKNLKIYPNLSEETTAFTATLYIDGVEICECKNSGQGGQTDIRVYNDKKHTDLIDKAEAFLKEKANGKKSYEGYLIDFVDDLVGKEDNKKEKAKMLKKMEKDCLTKIVIISKKVLDDFVSDKSLALEYSTINMKNPLTAFNQNELKAHVNLRILPTLKGDEIIYNKNLPK
jgi:hypothetical protein